MANLHTLRARLIKGGNLIPVYPRWTGNASVFSTGMVEGVVSLPVVRVGFVLFTFPGINIISVFAKKFRCMSAVVIPRARLAFVTYGFALFVIIAAGPINPAYGANLGSKWDGARFHNTDIIDNVVGDVKQRELREKRDTSIRSQGQQECWQGSETRSWSPDRTVKAHERAARFSQRDEIVRPAQLNVQKQEIKNSCDNNVTSIQSRTGELADNVTNNNALLKKLKMRGNVKTFSGGNVILEEIMYNDTTTNNTNSYSGYEPLNVSQNSPISSAQFSITQYASAISISGLEMIQNSGKEAIIDLLDGRMNVAEAQLANRIGGDIYLDGKQSRAVH